MAEINIGTIVLTNKQVSRLNEAHIAGVRGYRIENDFVQVNHQNDSLSTGEISSIVSALMNLPNEDTDKKKRVSELKTKPVLTLPEVTELLKLVGIA